MASHQEQLAQLRRERDDIKAEYREFVYVVAHDLAAPLRQTSGFGEIILSNNQETFDEKTKKHFGFILKAAESGVETLTALREFSRVETFAAPFEMVDCNEVLASVKSDLGVKIEASAANIENDDLPNLIADKGQIALVFHHLIANGLLYQADNNVPQISITCEERENSWLFSVADNGFGIPEHLRDKVFTILRRGVSPKEYPGAGMGLSVARKILQRHRGEIWIDPDVTIGTKLCFTIAKDLENTAL